MEDTAPQSGTSILVRITLAIIVVPALIVLLVKWLTG
jgi:hypothetical protein